MLNLGQSDFIACKEDVAFWLDVVFEKCLLKTYADKLQNSFSIALSSLCMLALPSGTSPQCVWLELSGRDFYLPCSYLR